jgi:hypothetical protein
MLAKVVSIGLLFLAASIVLSCEVDTKLQVKGGNPPQFVMSGSGDLGRLVVRGPKTLRHIDGPDSSAYWYIEIENPKVSKVSLLSPIAYGAAPPGYIQKYPESGSATPLIENEIYYVQVDTSNANGTSKYFIIKKGKVEFADYESQLTGN